VNKGLIFKTSNRTLSECLDRKLFGADIVARDDVLFLEPGDQLFLLNVDSDELTGPYEASSAGGVRLVPQAWKGSYPFQVAVRIPDTIGSIQNAKQVLTTLGLQSHRILADFESDILAMLICPTKNQSELLLDDEYVRKHVRRTRIQLRKTRKQLGLRPEGEERPPLESTTLWDQRKQSYGSTPKGNNKYAGVTPAFIIFNMVKRYTWPGDLVVDPMCGSGTTLDVCKEEGRKAIGYDIVPTRPDILKNDARSLPLKDNSVDMVFIDSPYGDNIKYNDSPESFATLSAESNSFYDELEKVMKESYRVLKPGKVLGWLIGDQWVKKKFTPVGFKMYEKLVKYFEPVDIISVARRSQTSNTGIWHNRALRHNFYLRGFKNLLIMRKSENDVEREPHRNRVKWTQYERTVNKPKGEDTYFDNGGMYDSRIQF